MDRLAGFSWPSPPCCFSAAPTTCHFRRNPFNLTAGSNVGILVVVTLNTDNLPVLVTTMGTCGCYKAMVPTEYLPESAYPKNWKTERQDIYGERLPPLLTFAALPDARILAYPAANAGILVRCPSKRMRAAVSAKITWAAITPSTCERARRTLSAHDPQRIPPMDKITS